MRNKYLLCAFAMIAFFSQAKTNELGINCAKPIVVEINRLNLELHNDLIKNSDSINLWNERNVSTIINEPFENFTDNGWTTYNVTGAQTWSIISFGNPAPAAIMNGFGGINEDWLISKKIDLTSGYDSASFSFQTDASFPGLPMEIYVTTDDYNNGASPTSVNWTRVNAVLDSDLTGYHGFVPSGDVDLTAYIAKNVRIAFKCVNVAVTTATSWEIDNFKVVASEYLGVANAASEKMKLYPNPVKDMLNFSEEITTVKITDLSGKLLLENLVKGQSINLSKLKKGIYVVIATLPSGETLTRKIVKE